MRKNEKGEVIITRKKASEIFFVLSTARYKLNGKVRTLAETYFRELEEIIGLKP